MKDSFLARAVPATRVASELYGSFKSLLPAGTADSDISRLPYEMQERAREIGRRLVVNTVPPGQRKAFAEFGREVVQSFDVHNQAADIIDSIAAKIPEMTLHEGSPEGDTRVFKAAALTSGLGQGEYFTVHYSKDTPERPITFNLDARNNSEVVNSRRYSDYAPIRKVEEALKEKLAPQLVA